MGYSDNDSAFLIIEDVNSFFDELKRQVPSAVEQNKHNLTNKRYYSPAIDDAPIYFDRIDYDVHQRNELFDEYQDPPAELFWKFTEYAQQAEVRIIISHWNFIQEFNLGQPEKYQPEQNYLKVNLPNLHSYARCFVPSEYFLEKR